MNHLSQLITEAEILGGKNSCELGHDWVSIGGRECPKGWGEIGIGCSQTVYCCERCGETDYGYPGGPAYEECETFCELKHLEEEYE